MEQIPTDIAQWFANTASLAAVVAALVALLRKHVVPALQGGWVVLTSVALGLVLAYLGHRLGYVGPDWIVFGLGGGLGASGGTAWLRSIMGGGGREADPSADTSVDASRSRLR